MMNFKSYTHEHEKGNTKMLILEKIAALVESGRVEVLRHGPYQPYDILPKYDARPIGGDETIIAVKDVLSSNTQSHLKGVYRRFVFIGTPEQEDWLIALIRETGLTHDDLVLILSTLKLNPAAFGETPIH